MAATSDRDTPATKQYVDYDEYVDFQIEKARSHIKATDIFTTITLLLAAFVGYLLVFVVFDQWVLEAGFSDWARSALLAVVLLAIGATLVRRVILPIVRRIHPLYAARMIEKADPKLKSNLLNFVDLQRAEGSEPAPDVLRAMQKRAAVELSHIDVDEAIDRRPLLRMAYALLGVVVVSALYIVFSPKDPFASVRRALLPTASIAVATETTIGEVTPGDDRVPARTQLTVEADVRGRDAERVQILVTTSDHKEVDQPVEMRRIDPDLPRFRGVLNGENGRGLLQSLTYSIVAGDARTRAFQIEVIQPPSARVDDVHLAFPSYMQFDERTTAGGGIDGWEGATVTVRATANMPVKSAVVVMTDTEDAHAKGEEITMQVADGTKLSAKWKLEFRSDGTCAHFYHVQLKTAKGETDPEPTVHPLRIRPDQRPDVALISPVGDLTGERARPANAIIPLLIQAVDPDFLLRSIRLRAERNGEEIVNEPLFENRELGQAIRGTHDWNLGALKPNLRPGEMVQFWIEVRDNKQPTANRAVTPRVNLEIRPEKSADEVRKDLAAEKHEQAEQLARADEQKNDGGSDPLPRKENDDVGNETPPERPGTQQPPREETSSADNEPRGEDRKPDGKSASESGGDRQRQPQPAGDDPQKALERLLQKQEADEQPEPKASPNEQKPSEQKEEKPSPDNKKKEAGENAANKTKGGAKKGAGKSADQENRANDPSPAQPDKKDGEDAQAKSPPRPDANATKKNSDEKSDGKGKKNPGESKSKNDKTGDGTDGDSKDQVKPDPSKSGAGDQESPQKKFEEKKSDDKKSGEKGTAAKQPDNKDSGEKKSDEESAKDKPERDDASPDKGTKKDPDSPAQPDGTNDKSKTGKEDGSKDANNESPKPDAKNPKPDGEQPSSDGAGDEENAAKGDDSDKGKKSKSDSKADDAKAGDASEPDTNPDSKKPSRDKKSDANSPEGEQEPTNDTTGAKKRKATGKESDEATGSDEDDPDAVKKNDAKRKPESKAGKMKPSESKEANEKRPGEKRKNDEGNSGATDDARKAKRPPDGKKPNEQPGPTDDPASKKPEKSPDAQSEKRPGNPPDAGNQDQKGDGRKKGQKSDQAEGGEKGESAASDQGKPGANKDGPGDQGDQPGESEKADGKTGKSGKESGKGSESKPSDKGGQSKAGDGGKSGKEGGKGDGKESGGNEGESSKSDGKGQPGKPGTKPGKSGSSQPGNASDGQSNSPVGGGINGPPSGDGSNDGDGTGDGEGLSQSGSGGNSVPSEEAEQARLDYAKKASNLLLNRLKEQLSRGEVDQKLLDEMGWKDMNDVTKFTQYLEDNLKNTSDEAKRLQFEESLKSMRLGNETIHRKGGEGPERRVEKTGSRVVPVPPEYRQQWEDYNKRIGRQRKTGEAKSAPPATKK